MKIQKTIQTICRILIAAVFLFSGFVKAVDPLGTTYKIEDYLAAFGPVFEFFSPVALPLAVMLFTFEFMLGFNLLFGISLKASSRLTLLFMSVMTALTLYLAIANPVHDCGCFGDALVISNWATFWKNVVLLAMAVCLIVKTENLQPFLAKPTRAVMSQWGLIFILSVTVFCYRHLPVFDFRPYKIGTHIADKMIIPEGAPQDEYETTFIYEKDGEQKEFIIENYPANDPAWTFVDQKSVLVKKGYEPPIHDFSIEVDEAGDITEEVLADPSYTFLLVSHKLELASLGHSREINRIYDYAQKNGYKFYCLNASLERDRDDYRAESGAKYPFATTDNITLKTIVRSNPGLVLVKDGTILNKWHANDLPTFTEPLEKTELGQQKPNRDAQNALWLALVFLVPSAVFVASDKSIRKIYTTIKNKRKMRKKIVAGNWKMNMNLQEGVALAKELNETLKAEKPNCDVVICTPYIHLASVAQFLDQNTIGLGAENCADKEKGAFTGEVSAEMVKSTGAQYVILGHSERRGYYGETPEILKEKVLLALKNNLKVIFCIGESLEEREANKQNDVVKAELEGSVFNLSADDFKKIIIAYEPIWAIGTGKTATADQAEEIHAFIRSAVAGKYGQQVADETSILYGGSCKASNAPELFAKPDIDGGLIGGAALKVADFKGIIDAFKK